MKTVSDGKLYDTERASRMASASAADYTVVEHATRRASREKGEQWDDYIICHEKLYVTTEGDYFLHGSGGKYRAFCAGGGRGGGDSAIIPLMACEARCWLEERDMFNDSHNALHAALKKATENVEPETGRSFGA